MRMLFPQSDVAGFAPVAAAAERDLGMFVVMMVVLRRQLGPLIDEWRRQVQPELDQLEAQATVARTIPVHLVPYMAPGIGALRLATLPDQEREAIQSEFRSLVEELPPEIRAQTGYDTPP